MIKALLNKLKYIRNIDLSPFEIAVKFFIITCSFFYMLICFPAGELDITMMALEITL